MGYHVEPFVFDRRTSTPIARGAFFQEGAFQEKPIQSVCYDSRNKKYILGFSQHSDGTRSTLVRVKDLSFTPESMELIVTDLPLGHCNDMAYDPDGHKIYVAQCGSNIGVVDPETLFVEKQIPLHNNYAVAIARYENGDFFVHDTVHGWRYKPDFGTCSQVSGNDWDLAIRKIPMFYISELNRYNCFWQGCVMIKDVPYMILTEQYVTEFDEPRNAYMNLISCEKGEDRTVYKVPTSAEVESGCLVDGKLCFVYGQYRIGGLEWNMNEITVHDFYNTCGPYVITAGKMMAINMSEYIPEGFELVSANVQFEQNGSVRTLPHFSTTGKCIIKVEKVIKNKIFIKSNKDYESVIFYIWGFCRKKPA